MIEQKEGVHMSNSSYPNIDMKRTGLLLKRKIKEAGYSVKDIQEKLMLSCPQPIYRWYKGTVMPSVDHLYVLSRLLYVHMEELLVPKYVLDFVRVRDRAVSCKSRMLSYWKELYSVA